jgi:hypothetical protein|tara:strand:- start:1032 stop:1298 length:267 start_codon:yes stop_codon:yes gene_type:complete
MALTKTTTVGTIEVSPATDTSAASTSNAKYPTIRINFVDTIDDSEDAALPVYNMHSKILNKFVEDGGSATDVSGEDALVQTICTAVWA